MSQAYFRQLNYTLANEDTAMELTLLPEGVGHILSVAGSGGRVLPLLARSPKLVTCVDMVDEQLYLAELRSESARALSHAEFLAFWGYPAWGTDGLENHRRGGRIGASPEERRDLFSKIRLTKAARDYLEGLFASKSWESVLYEGKWESTFRKLNRVNSMLTGERARLLFGAKTMDEQRAYLRHRFPKLAWDGVVFLLGNATIFNALLYKGHFPKKNIPDSFYSFYSEVFTHLFETGLVRENFFLQLLFFGRVVFPEGAPIEAQPETFAAIKKGLDGAEILYRRGDLIEVAKNAERPIDFFSFSDVPSYFTGDREKNFLQEVAPKLASGSLSVIRNYLHVPEGLDTQGFENVTARHQNAIQAEKVGVYLVDLYRKKG